MQELLDRIATEAGISNEQAKKSLDVIKAYVIEQFPMLAGAVENLFGGSESKEG